jgi:hypothetical protein
MVVDEYVVYVSPDALPTNIKFAGLVRKWESEAKRLVPGKLGSCPVMDLPLPGVAVSMLVQKHRINVWYAPETLMRHVPFMPPRQFIDLMTMKDRLGRGWHDAQCMLQAMVTFGKRAKEWLLANQRDGRDYYQSCFWLPAHGRSESAGLADYLFRFRRSKVDLLRAVAACWSKIPQEQRGLAPPKLFESCREIIMGEYRAKNPGLAKVAYLAGIAPSKYAAMEDRWLRSLAVPPAFPGVGPFDRGGYSARLLPRDDPRGLFLGALTNCCQYPGEAAASSAWHGQENTNGGFLVVEDRKGRVVAQSWLWRSGDVACVDSVESLGLEGERLSAVAGLYSDVADGLARNGVSVVVGSTGLAPKIFPRSKPAQGNMRARPPDGTYSDAKRKQRLVAISWPARSPIRSS